jgi:hypothetical protein
MVYRRKDLNEFVEKFKPAEVYFYEGEGPAYEVAALNLFIFKEAKEQYKEFKLKGTPNYNSIKEFISSTDVMTKVQGIVFEDKDYGKVLLAYDPKIIMPVEEAIVFERVVVDIIEELPEEEPEEEIYAEEPEEEDFDIE